MRRYRPIEFLIGIGIGHPHQMGNQTISRDFIDCEIYNHAFKLDDPDFTPIDGMKKKKIAKLLTRAVRGKATEVYFGLPYVAIGLYNPSPVEKTLITLATDLYLYHGVPPMTAGALTLAGTFEELPFEHAAGRNKLAEQRFCIIKHPVDDETTLYTITIQATDLMIYSGFTGMPFEDKCEMTTTFCVTSNIAQLIALSVASERSITAWEFMVPWREAYFAYVKYLMANISDGKLFSAEEVKAAAENAAAATSAQEQHY